MSLALGNPAPQWQDLGKVIGASARRLAPFLDASGFWVLLDSGNTPSGAYKLDVGSGFGVIDTTTTVGLKPTLLPSGFVVTY